MCKVQGVGWRRYVTGLVYSGLTTGEGMVGLCKYPKDGERQQKTAKDSL